MIDPKYEIEALTIADHEKGCDRTAYRVTRLDVAGNRVPACEQAWYLRKDAENMLNVLRYNDTYGDDSEKIEGERRADAIFGFILGIICGGSVFTGICIFLAR